MKEIDNPFFFMRKRFGLSQQELAKDTGLTPNDVCRLENGNLGAGVEKGITLAKYFSVSLEALISDSFEELYAFFTEGPKTSRKMQDRIKKLRIELDELGNGGEDWVYEQEVNKLKGTKYANAVNPNYADDEEAGCDILSFDLDGKHIYIEVKSTNGRASKAFYLTQKEKERAEECLSKGERYEIHRVHHLNNPKKRGRVIITAEELFKDYTFETDNFKISRKAD